MRFLAAAALLLLLCPGARAGFTASDIGTSGAQFLKLGAGARAEGMGEAYTAVADGADVMYWNPAALTRVEKHQATLMDSVLPAQINYGFAGYGQKMSEHSGAGAAVQYVNQPGIAETDSSGFNTGGTFHPSDLALSAGYGYRLHFEEGGFFDGASVGATGKYIQSTITHTESTYAADLGFLSAPINLFDQEFRFSYVAQNLGGSLRYQQLSDPLPVNLRLGTSYKATDGLTLAFDLNEPLDNNPYVAFGTEYTARFDNSAFSGRFGLNTRAIGETGGFSGLSFGVGAKFARIGMDYAFVAMGALGATHYVSVNFSF